MSFRQHVAQHLRLLLLQTLAEAPGFVAPPAILKQVAGNVGIPATLDQVETELAWLAEQGYLSWAGSGLPAVLNPRGEEVAAGLSIVPGVARPAPKAP